MTAALGSATSWRSSTDASKERREGKAPFLKKLKWAASVRGRPFHLREPVTPSECCPGRSGLDWLPTSTQGQGALGMHVGLLIRGGTEDIRDSIEPHCDAGCICAPIRFLSVVIRWYASISPDRGSGSGARRRHRAAARAGGAVRGRGRSPGARRRSQHAADVSPADLGRVLPQPDDRPGPPKAAWLRRRSCAHGHLLHRRSGPCRPRRRARWLHAQPSRRRARSWRARNT